MVEIFEFDLDMLPLQSANTVWIRCWCGRHLCTANTYYITTVWPFVKYKVKLKPAYPIQPSVSIASHRIASHRDLMDLISPDLISSKSCIGHRTEAAFYEFEQGLCQRYCETIDCSPEPPNEIGKWVF
jgi:hypothetical protein